MSAVNEIINIRMTGTDKLRTVNIGSVDVPSVKYSLVKEQRESQIVKSKACENFTRHFQSNTAYILD